jgi:hypothetical protein
VAPDLSLAIRKASVGGAALVARLPKLVATPNLYSLISSDIITPEVCNFYKMELPMSLRSIQQHSNCSVDIAHLLCMDFA